MLSVSAFSAPSSTRQKKKNRTEPLRLIVNFQFKIESIFSSFLFVMCCATILRIREHLVYFLCRLAIPYWFDLFFLFWYWVINVCIPVYETHESQYVLSAIRFGIIHIIISQLNLLKWQWNKSHLLADNFGFEIEKKNEK